jgi:hypothetical protein
VTQAVEDERAHRLEAVFRGFHGDRFKRSPVLLFEARGFNVAGADQIQPSAGF